MGLITRVKNECAYYKKLRENAETNKNTWTKSDQLETQPQRVRVNAPSKYQVFHELSGVKAISVPPLVGMGNDVFIKIYFTEGSLVSTLIPTGTIDII